MRKTGTLSNAGGWRSFDRLPKTITTAASHPPFQPQSTRPFGGTLKGPGGTRVAGRVGRRGLHADLDRVLFLVQQPFVVGKPLQVLDGDGPVAGDVRELAHQLRQRRLALVRVDAHGRQIRLNLLHRNDTVVVGVHRVQYVLAVLLRTALRGHAVVASPGRLPDAPPQISRKEPHEQRVDVDQDLVRWEQLRAGRVIRCKRRALPVRQVADFRRHAVHPVGLDGGPGHLHHVAGVILLNPVPVLEPSRDRVAYVGGLDPLRQQPPGHVHDADDLLGLDLGPQRLQRKESVGRVVLARADVAAHQQHGIHVRVGVLVGVQRLPDEGADEAAHRAHAAARSEGRQRTESVIDGV
mmetsp:Transcript_27590/g.44022  ORF Transcript_27590/g.44022 Transcript_27590/m.44022 type:complete len:352 (-) Transcript_27590:38-1093(-)